jgi:hypothetical protein
VYFGRFSIILWAGETNRLSLRQLRLSVSDRRWFVGISYVRQTSGANCHKQKQQVLVLARYGPIS